MMKDEALKGSSKCSSIAAAYEGQTTSDRRILVWPGSNSVVANNDVDNNHVILQKAKTTNRIRQHVDNP